MLKNLIPCLFHLVILSACTKSNTKETDSTVSLNYVDKIIINNDQLVDSTIVGGLSSIDYLGGNQFIVISDDRSEYSPARIYEIAIYFNRNGFINYIFNKTFFLKNKEGEFFELDELDPESIRYRSSSDTYFYTSEGGRTDEWINPFVWEMNREGDFLSEVEVPKIFYFNGA